MGAVGITVDIINDKALWDNFVDSSTSGSLFLKWDFLKIIEKYTDTELRTYGIYRGEELICMIPLFYKNVSGVKMIFSPPPRTGVRNLGFVTAPIFNTVKQRRKESYINTIVEDFTAEIKKISPRYMSVSMVENFIDIREFQWAGYNVDIEYTYTMDLKRPLTSIWTGFGKDCKEGIRSADRSRISFESTNDVALFYRFMEERYREQKLDLPLVKPDYLAELLATFPDNIKLYVLRRDNKIVDLEVACGYKDRYRLWMGGATIRKGSHGNQEYSTWELIKLAKMQGYGSFEIMGANIRRLCVFQSKFNPDLEFYFSIYKKDLVGVIAEWSYMNVMKRAHRVQPIIGSGEGNVH
jgi:hypothetical protein